MIEVKLVVQDSTISLGDFLDFLLLLQGVGGLQVALLHIDQLVGQHLSDGLLRPESVLADSLGNQVDSLVDSSEGRHIHCLLSNHTTRANSGRIFSGTGLNNSIDEDLKRVSSREEIDDFEGVPDDSDGLHLLTGVSAVELERANQSLDNGAESFSELFALVSAGSVGHKDLSFGGGGGDVVDEAGICDLTSLRNTLISSYCHLEKSLGAFSKPTLAALLSSRVTFSCFWATADMWLV
jgi:hypothetical protein